MSASSSFDLEVEKKENGPSPPSHLDLPPSSSSHLSPSPTAVGLVQDTPSSLVSPSDHLLPSLPIELKREILRFCDPSTLASTSRVSLAFLELSSPLLYRDIVVRGCDGLQKLFCSSDSSKRQPSLEVYLHFNQIRSLTFIGGQKDLEFDPADDSEEVLVLGSKLVLHQDRLSSSSSFRHDALSSVRDVTIQIEHSRRLIGHPFAFPALLNLLNPIRVVVEGTSPSMAPQDSFVYLDLPSSLAWSRLESVTFVNSGPWEHLNRSLVKEAISPRLRYGCDSSTNALDDVVGSFYEEDDTVEKYALLSAICLEKGCFPRSV